MLWSIGCVREEWSLGACHEQIRIIVVKDGAGNIVNPGFEAEWPEASAAAYRGSNCGSCGRDEMERVFDEYDDDGYELTVKMACNSCSAERLDVYRFHHYE